MLHHLGMLHLGRGRARGRGRVWARGRARGMGRVPLGHAPPNVPLLRMLP